jgi:hypothetical protein
MSEPTGAGAFGSGRGWGIVLAAWATANVVKARTIAQSKWRSIFHIEYLQADEKVIDP